MYHSVVDNEPRGNVRLEDSRPGRYFGAAAPLSTRALIVEQGRTEGSVKSPPKLVELVGSVSSRTFIFVF